MPTTAVSPDPLSPPQANVPLTDPAWHRWFYSLYEKLLKDGGNFPKLGIQGPEGIAKVTTENQFQRLINFDHGWYVNYSANNGNILYGYACNVRRSSGDAFTVGAQLNAWAARGCTGGVWGIATEAWGLDGFLGGLCGIEPAIINKYNDNRSAKWGIYSIFRNRSDATAPVVGQNRYNYWTIAHYIDATPRSSAGECSGWTKGIFFSDQCLDGQNPIPWNNTSFFVAGQVVTNGGFTWQAITTSQNQVPAAISAYWVRHDYAGNRALAIGIDFSSFSTVSMPRTFAAIRLRDTMQIQWESTGAVASWFDQGGSNRMVLVGNAGTQWLSVDITNGRLYRNGVFLI